MILFYDLERRSIRNLGVLRNLDTGIALNGDSTTRIQHARLFGIIEDEELEAIWCVHGESGWDTISNSAVAHLPETLQGRSLDIDTPPQGQCTPVDCVWTLEDVLEAVELISMGIGSVLTMDGQHTEQMRL